jgi:hypothetical protein
MDLALPVDIRAEIFRNVLQDSRFKAWKDFHRQWQLHISAGPGSGKVSNPSVWACSQNVSQHRNDPLKFSVDHVIDAHRKASVGWKHCPCSSHSYKR